MINSKETTCKLSELTTIIENFYASHGDFESFREDLHELFQIFLASESLDGYTYLDRSRLVSIVYSVENLVEDLEDAIQ